MVWVVICRDNGYPTDECRKPTWDEALHLARKWAECLTSEDFPSLKAGEQVEIGDCETIEIQEQAR